MTARPGRIVCFGELLLRLGAPGRELLLQRPRLDVFVGGAEANVAAGLARLGHNVSMATIVADNALGDAALGELRRHGVSTALARRAAGRMGLYFLTTGAAHRPSEVLYDRAGSAFAEAPDDIDWATALDGAAWLHLSGITAALGSGGALAAKRAVETAGRLGVSVSFDFNYRSTLWAAWDGHASTILRELVAGADLVFGNERDFALVLGHPFEDAASACRAAFEAFPRLAVVAATSRELIGADHHVLSARLATRVAMHGAGPVDVAPVIDRIGGGDAFAAGILHGIISGMPLDEVVRIGLASSCLKHGIPGDLALVDREGLDRVLAAAPSDVRR